MGDSPSCSCLPNYFGNPPNCKPECVNNAECPSNLACINLHCKDPCPGTCGQNAECRVVSHTPMCVCLPGYEGDPFSFCQIKQTVQYEQSTPCVPNPCGVNAICKEQNGAGACQCLPEYFGNPYEGCRPECVLNSDCPSNRACVRNKCVDPCPGTCGQNADCQVVNHLPSCTCRQGYTGDPYRYCSLPLDEQRKNKFFCAPSKCVSLSINHSIYNPIQLLPMNMSILVNHRHAVRIANVERSMARPCAHVCPNTSEAHRHADPNVWSAPNVPAIRHASIRNAKIHAPVFVAQMPNVASTITVPSALVAMDSPAIRSQDAIRYLVS